jgi:plastocyanin
MVPAGHAIPVSNVGGEFHTFSETTNPFLDPEAGGTISSTTLGPGTHRFICCIHPWMRATYRVR